MSFQNHRAHPFTPFANLSGNRWLKMWSSLRLSRDGMETEQGRWCRIYRRPEYCHTEYINDNNRFWPQQNYREFATVVLPSSRPTVQSRSRWCPSTQFAYWFNGSRLGYLEGMLNDVIEVNVLAGNWLAFWEIARVWESELLHVQTPRM